MDYIKLAASKKTDDYYIYLLRKSKGHEVEYVGIPIEDWEVDENGYSVVPNTKDISKQEVQDEDNWS